LLLLLLLLCSLLLQCRWQLPLDSLATSLLFSCELLPLLVLLPHLLNQVNQQLLFVFLLW
jgi:hypothetical protein